MSEQTPVRVSLIEVNFRDMRTGGDGTSVQLSIVWDQERRVFDFQGDTELCTPAARQFFDEVLASAMDRMREYLIKADP